MIVLVGASVGLIFATLGMAFTRMGAFHLYALPGSPAHLTGLPLVLPFTQDLQGIGIAMIAAGWFLISYMCAYLAGTIARTVAAATLVQLVMTAAALVIATQGLAPWWMAGSSVILAWWGGRLGENALCRASRPERRRIALEEAAALAQLAANDAGPLSVSRPAPALPRAVAPLPGFGQA